MATNYFNARHLADALQAEGLIPPNCASVELLLPANGAIAVRYERLLGADDLLAFSRALAVFAAARQVDAARQAVVDAD